MPLRVDVKKICTVKCDSCGKRAGSENFPWVSVELAKYGAREDGWVMRNGGNCCPACKERLSR